MRYFTRRLAVVVFSVSAAALTIPAVGMAATRQHAREYERAYHAVAHKFGHRAPGRDIVRWGIKPRGRPATDAQVAASLSVLRRMLAPPPPVVAPVATTAVSSTSAASTSYSASSSSGLVSCIISAEGSGGNPTIVNSSGHMGIGQWDQATWMADTHGQYGATPLDASASQQIAVIQQQVAAGNTGQWTNYDRC